MKRPSSILKLPKNDADLSLEEKMEAFQKKANGNVQTFLDSLTQGQREALWGRFSRARDALKDTKATELWNTHCKGKGSEEKKKQLLAVFLKNRGDLKKAGIYQKELVALTEVSGSLAGRTQVSMGVLAATSFLLLVTCECVSLRQQGNRGMGAIPSHFDKVWITGGHEESTLAAICIVCIAHLAINP